MKKVLSIILIIFGIFAVILLIDTLQAKSLNNRPFIKVTENYDTGNLYQKDKGILVDTYIYTNGKEETVFKWEKYTYSIDKDEDNDKDGKQDNKNSNNAPLSKSELENMALDYFLRNTPYVLSRNMYNVGSSDNVIDEYKNKDMIVIEIRHINDSINTLDARYYINVYTAKGFDDMKKEIDLNKDSKQDKFGKHKAVARTKRVGGLIAYYVHDDMINEIPEEYFLNLDKDITYEELVSEIGEPSGSVGSGMVRYYWRIGENKYAVWEMSGYFEIWEGND